MSTSSQRTIAQRLSDRSWGWLVRNVALPLGDRAFRQPVARRLRELERLQWRRRDQLRDARDAALRSLIRTACAEVPFYRELYESAGVDPGVVRRAADLAALPVATKELLRAGFPERTVRRTSTPQYVVSSSGSTGANFQVMEDSETASVYRAALMLSFEWAGWRVGDPHVQTGMTLDRTLDRRLKDFMLRCHYVSSFDLTDAHLDAALDVLERRRIEFLFGYPGSIYYLARRAAHRGWNRPLRAVMTWGDNLFAHYRRTIEEAFRTKVLDTYGCGEGIQVAAQCGVGTTYHIHTPDVIVEIVDDSGSPVPPGTTGHILLTRLHPGPMPFIRYRVGDIGALAEGECACGRGFDLLERVEGRDTDVVLTPSGNRLIVHFFTGIIEHFPEVASFQVVQSEAESITLRLVPDRTFAPGTEQRVVEALRAGGADALRIDVEIVDEIPVAASGKRRFVISDYSRLVSDASRGR